MMRNNSPTINTIIPQFLRSVRIKTIDKFSILQNNGLFVEKEKNIGFFM